MQPEKIAYKWLQLEKRGKLLDKNNFFDYVNYFEQNPPRGWEEKLEKSKEVINEHRSYKVRGFEKLLTDDEFLSRVYDVVKLFMESQYKKAEMVEKNEFQRKVKEFSPVLSELVQYKLSELSEEEFKEIKNKIEKEFFTKTKWSDFKLKIMKGDSQLVGFSKTLYHLAPDLFPPIDRKYVIYFFYNNTSFSCLQERNKFLEVLDWFYYISKHLALTEKDLRYNPEWRWNTSIPKLIDHAIIGFVRKEFPRRKDCRKP